MRLVCGCGEMSLQDQVALVAHTFATALASSSWCDGTIPSLEMSGTSRQALWPKPSSAQ